LFASPFESVFSHGVERLGRSQGLQPCANYLIIIFVVPECFSSYSNLLSGYTIKYVHSNETTTKCLRMGETNSSISVHGFLWLCGSSGEGSVFKKYWMVLSIHNGKNRNREIIFFQVWERSCILEPDLQSLLLAFVYWDHLVLACLSSPILWKSTEMQWLTLTLCQF